LREASERAGQRFHLDAPGWFTDSDPPPLLTNLARAVWGDQTTLCYRRTAEVTRTVEPYGLVLKNGVWYLVQLLRHQVVNRHGNAWITSTPPTRRSDSVAALTQCRSTRQAGRSCSAA
jgi:WYL domain